MAFYGSGGSTFFDMDGALLWPRYYKSPTITISFQCCALWYFSADAAGTCMVMSLRLKMTDSDCGSGE